MKSQKTGTKRGKIKVTEMWLALKVTTNGMGEDGNAGPGPSELGITGGVGSKMNTRHHQQVRKSGGSKPERCLPIKNHIHIHEHVLEHKRFLGKTRAALRTRVIKTSTHPYRGLSQSITSGSAAMEKLADPGSAGTSLNSGTSLRTVSSRVDR